jgi:protein involved in polysaccharide export with SLBB domain
MKNNTAKIGVSSLRLLGFGLLIAMTLLSTSLFGQAQSVFQAQQELADRGIDEEELRLRLQKKGVDLDDLSEMSQEEALGVQNIVEETILEMSATDLPTPRTSDLPIDHNLISTNIKEDISSSEDPLPNTLKKDTLPDNIVSIYGQHIFKSNSRGNQLSGDNVKPPPHYKLGPGDELIVSIWGLSQLDEKLVINDQGYVRPYRMPRIYLKGFTYAQAQSLLRDRFSKYYNFRRNEFDVVVNYSRQIDISIYGEVENYGSYSVPAVLTVFDALGLAGGPTEVGSVREIKLIRAQKVITIDVYEYMFNPSDSKDYYLEQNDIIQVPVASKVVTIQGQVNRPFKYEIIEGEGLLQAIDFAGGLKAQARSRQMDIIRYSGDKQMAAEVDYDDLRAKNGHFELFNGDIISVGEITRELENWVSVSGEVLFPGIYPRKDGMTIRDLIEKVGLPETARKDISDDGDELTVYAMSRFVDSTYFSVKGAVREPGVFNFDRSGQTTVYEAIVMSGGLKSNANRFAYIYRKDVAADDKRSYIRIDLDEVLSQPASRDNIALAPFDDIVVGSLGAENEDMFFDVIGAVMQPGRYSYGEGLSLTDALRLSGGFTFAAASNRIDLFRVELKDNVPTKTMLATYEVGRDLQIINQREDIALMPYDQIVVREVPEFGFQENIFIEGEVTYPGLYALSESNEKLSNIVSRAGGLTLEAFSEGATLYRSYDSIGFVVINLEEALKNSDSRFNVILKDGDQIFIPKQQNLVRIIGFTNAHELYPEKILNDQNGIAVPYHSGKNAKFYIDKFAAGVSNEGSLCLITVEHANGQIERAKNYGFFKSYPRVGPGAIIRVGKKEERDNRGNISEDDEKVDWGQVFSNSIVIDPSGSEDRLVSLSF